MEFVVFGFTLAPHEQKIRFDEVDFGGTVSEKRREMALPQQGQWACHHWLMT